MSAGLIILVLLGLLLLAILVSLVRTLCMPSLKSGYVPAPDPVRADRYAEKLSRMVRCETVSVPSDYGVRSLLIYTKNAPTPAIYPRKAGTPSKNPL